MMSHSRTLLLAILTATCIAGCTSTTTTRTANTLPDAPDASSSDNKTPASREARAKAHVDLGMGYLELGRYDIALNEANVALEDSSSYAPAYYLRAIVHMVVNEPHKARENFERAISLDPKESDFTNAYGWFLCTQGNERKGLEMLEKAARDPFYRFQTRAYNNAGLCYIRIKNDTAAEAQFRRSLELEPTNRQALFMLADIAYRRGQYPDARDYLIRLQRNNEPGPDTAWLGLRTERALGNRNAEASYAEQLRTRFPDSAETTLLREGKFE